MIRFGVLSTASIAPRFVKGILLTEGCEVAAVSSRDLAKAQKAAEEWGAATAFGDHREMLESDAIDVAYIPIINTEHFRYTKMALECGKHVICEKPMVETPEEARELFALAREKGLFLMEAQKSVFLPVIQKIKELIQAGEFGEIRMADFSNSIDPTRNKWMFDEDKFGGPLYGHGPYSVEIMQYLFDCRITQACAMCTRSTSRVEGQLASSFLMENGLLFTNRTSTVVDTQQMAHLYGEKGSIEIPEYWKSRKAILHYKDREPVVLEFPCDYEMVYEVEHAAECIRKGLTESPVMTEAVTVNTLEMLREADRMMNPEKY